MEIYLRRRHMILFLLCLNTVGGIFGYGYRNDVNYCAPCVVGVVCQPCIIAQPPPIPQVQISVPPVMYPPQPQPWLASRIYHQPQTMVSEFPYAGLTYGQQQHPAVHLTQFVQSPAEPIQHAPHCRDHLCNPRYVRRRRSHHTYESSRDVVTEFPVRTERKQIRVYEDTPRDRAVYKERRCRFRMECEEVRIRGGPIN